MKNLILKKQSKPEFGELYRMLFDLKDFLDEDVDFRNYEWVKNLDTVIDFQNTDGSFDLLDSNDIPGDAREEFCHQPTYLCTAVLMKAYMTDPSSFTVKEKSALFTGLKMSCTRNLMGHGYEGLKGQIEALNIFMKAGVREFIDLYSDLSPEFTAMCEKVISDFSDREAQSDFTGPWGESYEDEIRSVNKYFRRRKVFVYGTLMEDEANHHYLENSAFLGKGTVNGYDMYDCGWYPAIVPGDNLIIGELYDVPLDDMPAIDRLEGKGSLYEKKCERVTVSGRTEFCFIYVYLGDVDGLEGISAWNSD